MGKRFLWVVLWWTVAWPAAAAQTILVLGDSLSAGYGIPVEAGWVNLLKQRLAGSAYEVINASISGETSAGGRSRLPKLLQRDHPAVVVIELGGNDGLRGLPLDELHANLAAMVDAARAAGARVLLVGMRLPPNYGPAYTRKFHEVFEQVAAEKGVPLVPFLLEGVAGHPELMQADGIHANAGGQGRLLENVWGELGLLVK